MYRPPLLWFDMARKNVNLHRHRKVKWLNLWLGSLCAWHVTETTVDSNIKQFICVRLKREKLSGLGFLLYIFLDEQNGSASQQISYQEATVWWWRTPTGKFSSQCMRIRSRCQNRPKRWLKGNPMNKEVDRGKFLLCLCTSWLLRPLLSCTNLNEKA